MSELNPKPLRTRVNPIEFVWNDQKEKAVLLLAQGKMGPKAIAKKIGVSRPVLYLWRKTPEFKQRVNNLHRRIRVAICRHGIAVMEYRVRALQDRWMRMQRVITERAADPAMKAIPGGSTGMLSRWVKTLVSPDGKSTIMEEEYRFDAALCTELRADEKQAGQELGQWSEKHEYDGKFRSETKVKIDLSGFTDSDLLRLERSFRADTLASVQSSGN